MKKLVIILATLLVAGCSSGVEEKLVGRWRGISDGEDVVMIFKENNKISIQVGSDIGQGTYHVYGSTNPYDLDIDFDESRSRQSRRGKIGISLQRDSDISNP